MDDGGEIIPLRPYRWTCRHCNTFNDNPFDACSKCGLTQSLTDSERLLVIMLGIMSVIVLILIVILAVITL
jgi:hypothetical protein